MKTKKGILYTSYFSKLKTGRGIKISVSRFNPEWLKKDDVDYTFSDLAPSTSLLLDYKYRDILWSDYTERYMKEQGLYNNNINKQLIEVLNMLDNGYDVTLYCYEKSNKNCHRHILSNYISKLGYNVEEIL